MTYIINCCAMPKDGVNVNTTNTTPSDITFTGLTAGVKYHALQRRIAELEAKQSKSE